MVACCTWQLLYVTSCSLQVYSQGLWKPNQIHLSATKKGLECLKGTIDFGLLYLKEYSKKLMGYTDSDWARGVDDFKCTWCYYFSPNNGVFC